MTVRLPIQAVAPDFGVRVIVERNIVHVMASDSGGRGCAHGAIVLPVEPKPIPGSPNSRLQIRGIDDLDQRLPKWNELEDVGARFLEPVGVTVREPHDPRPPAEPPYFYKIARARWPGHDPVLVLLFYIQSAGIGATVPAAPVSARLREIDTRDDLSDRVVGAIAVALARPANELRGGLVEGRIQDADAAAESLTFAVASCHYPSDVLDHMPDGENDTPGPADASLLALGRLMTKADRRPSLLLLAGDQVYTDATGGLFDPKILDDKFRIPYERRGASRGAQSVLQRLDLEVRMMMDDHEIRDNWEPPDPIRLRDRGKRYYFRYQRSRANLTPNAPLGPIWFAFEHQGFAFFMGDTRTERQGRTALNFDQVSIMSEAQFCALQDWLDKTRGRPRFVLTSTALFPRRLAVSRDPTCALQSDAWDGYPRSQHRLLSLLCEGEHEGVLFLSGDDHRSSYCEIDIAHDTNGKTCRCYSIHSSALYAPYSFANGAEANFNTNDTFGFRHEANGPYTCSVKTTFARSGDGFAIVTADREKADWRGSVEFHDAKGPKPNGRITFPLIGDDGPKPQLLVKVSAR